jgi:RNA polymerase sigma-70 factor (ECF subfamily)
MKPAAPEHELARALGAGRGPEFEAYLETAYANLRRLARSLVAAQRRDFTPTPTDLLHAALLNVMRRGGATIERPAQFLAVAVAALKNALVDHLRRRGASRRGGDKAANVGQDALTVLPGPDAASAVRVAELLDELAATNRRYAEFATMRYFGGLSAKEIAAASGLSVTTVDRSLRTASAWLRARYFATAR